MKKVYLYKHAFPIETLKHFILCFYTMESKSNSFHSLSWLVITQTENVINLIGKIKFYWFKCIFHFAENYITKLIGFKNVSRIFNLFNCSFQIITFTKSTFDAHAVFGNVASEF